MMKNIKYIEMGLIENFSGNFFNVISIYMKSSLEESNKFETFFLFK